jgi:hypothetical protein
MYMRILHMYPPAHIPPWPKATILLGTQELTLQTSMVGGLQNGLGTRLGVIPQQTPVNPQKNQKSAPYKMVAPS